MRNVDVAPGKIPTALTLEYCNNVYVCVSADVCVGVGVCICV